MAWANSRLSTGGTRNAAVGSVPDGGAGGCWKRFPRKPALRRADPAGGQACPLEALITEALSSKIAMKRAIFATKGAGGRAQAGG